jgi:hypothetical protein
MVEPESLMTGRRAVDSAAARFCILPSQYKTMPDFLADVASARRAIARHDAICNMCDLRYDFMVLLCAALLNGQTTVLPSSRAPRARLRRAGAAIAALTGQGACLHIGFDWRAGQARQDLGYPGGWGKADR